VQVLSLLAAEGAVAGHVAAVDGSPVSGNASRFANLTGEQLADRIAAVEAAIDAEAEAWLAGAAGTAQQPLRGSDGDDDDDLPGGGVPRRLAGLAATLARLRAAEAKLAERQAAGGTAARIDAARDAAEGAARRLAQQIVFTSNGELQVLGKCLDDRAFGHRGTGIILFTCNGGANQRWEYTADGAYVLAFRHLCLDDPAFNTTDGTQLIVWSCNGGANQKWSPPS
jgi:hypothetical protein